MHNVVKIFSMAAAFMLGGAGGAWSSGPPEHPPIPGPGVPAHYHQPGHTTSDGHAHSHGHQHHGPECHACIPGVYRTEIKNFRGDGFVARKHPFLPWMHNMERSGYPNKISHLAEPGYGHKYTAYYVGGGASFGHGFPSRRKEGTWGRDYDGFHLRRHVALGWSRGRLYQDGTAQYEPDAHTEITNVFAIRYGDRIHRLIGQGENEADH